MKKVSTVSKTLARLEVVYAIKCETFSDLEATVGYVNGNTKMSFETLKGLICEEVGHPENTELVIMSIKPVKVKYSLPITSFIKYAKKEGSIEMETENE